MDKPIAQIALLLWLPVTWHLFKRHPLPRAAMFAFLGGLLILPNYVEIKLPLLPGVTKYGMINLAMVIALWRQRPAGNNPRVERWWYIAAAGTFLSGLVAGLTNPDPLIFTRASLPGHTFKDAMAIAMATLLGAIPASYLGMRCFRSARDVGHIMRILAGAGLVYSIPILIELRMSPQFHNWVYGYASPHEWGQVIRYGGYRPLVMFTHGLVLSLFMLSPTIAAASVARVGGRVGKLGGKAATWILSLMVVLCKSTGVWFYAAFAVPMARFSSAKAMLRLSSVMVIITCLYPWLRANEYLPIDALLGYAGRISDERQQSLEFRFRNEDILLAKAMLRPWFGWGSYGRNRVYDEDGVDICVTDGAWILTLGTSGFIGGAFYYMFAVFPVLIAGRRIPRIRDPQLRHMLSALTLLCAVTWFDNLPNAPGFYISEFLGGALCSLTYSALRDQQKARSRRPEVSPPGHAVRPVAAQVS